MTLRVYPLLLCLALGCSAPGPYEVPAADGPAVQLHAPPDVRVIALQALPHDGGWTLAGRLALRQPVLPAARQARLEGLDGTGRALFDQPLELHLRPVPPRYGGPREATLRAELPAGVSQLRLTLPAGR